MDEKQRSGFSSFKIFQPCVMTGRCCDLVNGGEKNEENHRTGTGSILLVKFSNFESSVTLGHIKPGNFFK